MAEEKTARDHVRAILASLGEDPDREGLLKTPERVEKALRFLTQGYAQDAETFWVEPSSASTTTRW